MASQMPDARVLKTTVEFTAAGPGGEACVFTATGKAIEFAGYRRAYVEGSDDPDSELEAQETILPAFAEGDLVVAPGGTRRANPRPRRRSWTSSRSATRRCRRRGSPRRRSSRSSRRRGSAGPPPTSRRSRRSCGAATCSARARRSCPASPRSRSPTCCATTSRTSWTSASRRRWSRTSTKSPTASGLRWISSGASTSATASTRDSSHWCARGRPRRVDYPVIDVGEDPDTSQAIRVRIGKFGPFLQRRRRRAGQHRVAARRDAAGGPRRSSGRWSCSTRRRPDRGNWERTRPPGLKVYVNNGRFGPYVQLGETPEKAAKGAKAEKPKRASLPRGMTEADVTCDRAAPAQPAPRAGRHPESGQPIVANNGRFGPYVKHGDEFRSLAPDDDVYSDRLERAVALLAEPKQSRRRQSAAKTVLRELGTPRRTTARPSSCTKGATVRTCRTARPTRRCRRERIRGHVGLHEAVRLLERPSGCRAGEEGRAGRKGGRRARGSRRRAARKSRGRSCAGRP